MTNALFVPMSFDLFCQSVSCRLTGLSKQAVRDFLRRHANPPFNLLVVGIWVKRIEAVMKGGRF